MELRRQALEEERRRREQVERRLQSESSRRQQLVEKEVKMREKQFSQARPLTRYLPNRKEDFDLKTHIESSGHGVDTCLHVVLSSKVQGVPWGAGVLGPQDSGLSSCPNTGGLCPRTWYAVWKRCWGQPP